MKKNADFGHDDGDGSARGGGRLQTLRVGMECNYAPYNWTQSDASENAVAIAAGGYADGYDVRIAKIIADQLGMELKSSRPEWDGLTPALLSRQHRRDYRGHEPRPPSAG